MSTTAFAPSYAELTGDQVSEQALILLDRMGQLALEFDKLRTECSDDAWDHSCSTRSYLDDLTEIESFLVNYM